jgi:protein-tyrosine phosphatase
MPFNDGNIEYRDFRQACELLINRYQRYSEKILVHCAAGVSRSVSVAAVTVAVAETTGFDTALEQVMTRRNIGIDPNPELQRYGRRYIGSQDL